MKLIWLRKQIDLLDYWLLFLLSKRKNVVLQVARYKLAHDLPPLDARRWQHVLITRKHWGKKLGINTEFTEHLFNTVHDYSLQIEGEICKK